MLIGLLKWIYPTLNNEWKIYGFVFYLLGTICIVKNNLSF